MAVDFGEFFFAAEPVQTTGIPTVYAAPEIPLSTKAAGFGSDIWSLACAVFEIWSTELLFCANSAGISMMVRDWEMKLGPLPEPYRTARKDSPDRPWKFEGEEHSTSAGSSPMSPASWNVSDFAAQKEWILSLSTGYTEVLESLIGREMPDLFRPPNWKDLPEHVRAGEPILYRLPRQDVLMMTDLVRKMVAYDPAERVDAGVALQHPWFMPSYIERMGLVSVRNKFCQLLKHFAVHMRAHRVGIFTWGLGFALLSIPLLSRDQSRSAHNVAVSLH